MLPWARLQSFESSHFVSEGKPDNLLWWLLIKLGQESKIPREIMDIDSCRINKKREKYCLGNEWGRLPSVQTTQLQRETQRPF